jgi:hypothetical protein
MSAVKVTLKIVTVVLTEVFWFKLELLPPP